MSNEFLIKNTGKISRINKMLVNEYLEEKSKNSSKALVRLINYNLNYFLCYLVGYHANKSLGDFQYIEILKWYRNFLKYESKQSDRVINCRIAMVQGLYTWLLEKRYINFELIKE